MLRQSEIKNISRYEGFRAYLTCYTKPFISPFHAYLAYQKTYRNYARVIFQMLKSNYPIEAVTRSGENITFRDRSEISFVTRMVYHGCNEIEITDDKLTIFSYLSEKNKKNKISVYDGITNGDLCDIFFDRVYEFLPINGKTVIDVGANIGDSCIYFVLREPKQIIAIEPFPKNYESAKKNIDMNGFSDNVILCLAGCAGETGDINIDPLYESNACSSLEEFNQGIKIPLITLNDILTQNNISGEAVLKMDCEGCEYQAILSSTSETLRFFSHILIEYHFGYKNLREKLEKSGFQVSVTRPLWEYSSPTRGKKMGYTGYIYAVKKE